MVISLSDFLTSLQDLMGQCAKNSAVYCIYPEVHLDFFDPDEIGPNI